MAGRYECNANCLSGLSVRVKTGLVAVCGVLCALVGCTSTDDDPDDLPPTTIPTSAVAGGGDAVLLGSMDFFPGKYDRGFGRPHPRKVFNGGDPAGLAVHVQWTGWGEAVAHGTGNGSAFMPKGGYYPEPVQVELRATDLGPGCDGQVGYHSLMVRKEKAPNTGEWSRWHSWWYPGRSDICG